MLAHLQHILNSCKTTSFLLLLLLLFPWSASFSEGLELLLNCSSWLKLPKELLFPPPSAQKPVELA